MSCLGDSAAAIELTFPEWKEVFEAAAIVWGRDNFVDMSVNMPYDKSLLGDVVR
jgi:hypothetical protein